MCLLKGPELTMLVLRFCVLPICILRTKTHMTAHDATISLKIHASCSHFLSHMASVPTLDSEERGVHPDTSPDELMGLALLSTGIMNWQDHEQMREAVCREMGWEFIPMSFPLAPMVMADGLGTGPSTMRPWRIGGSTRLEEVLDWLSLRDTSASKTESTGSAHTSGRATITPLRRRLWDAYAAKLTQDVLVATEARPDADTKDLEAQLSPPGRLVALQRELDALAGKSWMRRRVAELQREKALLTSMIT